MKKRETYRRNKEKNRAELQAGAETLSSMPRALNAALSTRCNLSCRMCEVRKIAWEIPRRTIDEIIGLFPFLERAVWQGGEVFLLDYFKEILEAAAPYENLRHEITTSAHLITPEWVKRIDRVRMDLNISVDAVSREVYESIRRGASFGTLLEKLDLLAVLKDRGRRQVLVMIATVMESNYRQLEQFIEFAREHGFNRLILQPVKGNFDNAENIFFRNDISALGLIADKRPLIRKKAQEYGIELLDLLPVPEAGRATLDNDEKEPGFLHPVEAEPREGESELFCYAPWQQLFIEWGGSVYPHCLCLQDGTNEHKKLGSVLQSSLDEIWNGTAMRSFRRKIKEGRMKEVCNPLCLSGAIDKSARNLPLR
ncbi:MAG TPA: radical SAM protein [bacterium]|nr:radical SAM protein [bacterium]